MWYTFNMTSHDGTVLRRTEKKCSQCSEIKKLSEFSKDKSRKDGVDSYCKPCRYKRNRYWAEENKESYRESTRNTRRKIEYGINPEEFNRLLEDQHYRCAICKISIDQTSHLDHCHNTGTVRGILCKKCNLGLGFFDDNIDKLYSSIEYIKKYM